MSSDFFEIYMANSPCKSMGCLPNTHNKETQPSLLRWWWWRVGGLNSKSSDWKPDVLADSTNSPYYDSGKARTCALEKPISLRSAGKLNYRTKLRIFRSSAWPLGQVLSLCPDLAKGAKNGGNGGLGGDWTLDNSINSRLLYRLSYQTTIVRNGSQRRCRFRCSYLLSYECPSF